MSPIFRTILIIVVLALAALGIVVWVFSARESERRSRYERVFPGGKPFATRQEAAAQMATVSVQVWSLHARTGRKTLVTRRVTVNARLADDVQAIFREIAADPERFPIKRVEGFNFRPMVGSSMLSHHSYGTAIDINPEENYFIDRTTGTRSGKYWKPGADPYSIPEHGSVVRAFRNHGWSWGGHFIGASDYMHFTYLGG